MQMSTASTLLWPALVLASSSLSAIATMTAAAAAEIMPTSSTAVQKNNNKKSGCHHDKDDATLFRVPQFTLQDLWTGHQAVDFADALTTTGILAVTLPDTTEQDHARAVALQGWCDCHETALMEVSQQQQSIGQVQQQELSSSVLRTSLATATAGTTPLPLPDITSTCGTDTVTALEQLRDQVAHVTQAFVWALDRLLSQQQQYDHDGDMTMLMAPSLLMDTFGTSYRSMRHIVGAANHLEHLHHYEHRHGTAVVSASTSNVTPDSNLTLDWHTDAGLFLAFVPAWSCHDHADHSDASFFVQPHGGHHFQNGQALDLSNHKNSVIFMLGAGAEHWLDTPVPLRATRHAVALRPGTARSWYGMMHLVPDQAIVQKEPVQRTFAAMKRNMVVPQQQQDEDAANNDGVSIGCGYVTPQEMQTLETDRTASSPRRRLQHVEDAGACNNSTNFFCWMSCLDIPQRNKAAAYLSNGYSLYCLDPARLATSGNKVSEAVKPCEGFVHNAACQGSWQPTDPTVPAAHVITNASNVELPFCYGGTSMYMDGFHFLDTTCIIYLFPGWVLTSAGKLIAASFGTLGVGAILELVIHQRRRVMESCTPGVVRLLASATFYGLQLTIGYFLMLVVMTYSGPLFMCAVLGLVGGHVLFNAKDALLVRHLSSRAPQIEAAGAMTEDCECDKHQHREEDRLQQEQHSTATGTTTGSCACSRKGEEYGALATAGPDESNSGVPEGSTPCCQHVL